MLLFIPDQYLPHVGVVLEQAFVAFAHQKVDGRGGLGAVQLLQQGRSQNHVADEGGLNEQDGAGGRHGAAVKAQR